MNKEEVELLKRIRGYLPNHSGFGTMNAVYITPAESLRRRADEMEAQERDEELFDDLIKKYEWHRMGNISYSYRDTSISGDYLRLVLGDISIFTYENNQWINT